MATNYYPQELGSTSMPNAIRFYINERSTYAPAAEQKKAGGAKHAAAQEALSKDYTSQNRAKEENYERALKRGGQLTAAVGMLAKGAQAATGEGATLLGKGLLTAGTAYVAGEVAENLATPTETIRLIDDIALYVPQSFIAAYAANWDEVDTGVAGAYLGAGNKSLGDLSSTGEFAARGVVATAAALPQALGASMDLGAVLEASSKKVNNPYKEQLFKSMGFRQFSFSYTFSPRNPSEQMQVEQLIRKFRLHMHPAKAPGDLFLIYPAEFSLVFETLVDGRMVKNEHLPAISSCALKNCKVVYGADGSFNTFKESGGAATEITMELQFLELEALTKDRIEAGL